MQEGYEISDAARLSQKAKMIYLYLKRRGGKDGKAWPSVKTIAGDLGISESSVRRGIRELEKEKLLSVRAAFRTNGARTSNRYFPR